MNTNSPPLVSTVTPLFQSEQWLHPSHQNTDCTPLIKTLTWGGQGEPFRHSLMQVRGHTYSLLTLTACEMWLSVDARLVLWWTLAMWIQILGWAESKQRGPHWDFVPDWASPPKVLNIVSCLFYLLIQHHSTLEDYKNFNSLLYENLTNWRCMKQYCYS